MEILGVLQTELNLPMFTRTYYGPHRACPITTYSYPTAVGDTTCEDIHLPLCEDALAADLSAGRSSPRTRGTPSMDIGGGRRA